MTLFLYFKKFKDWLSVFPRKATSLLAKAPFLQQNKFNDILMAIKQQNEHIAYWYLNEWFL